MYGCPRCWNQGYDSNEDCYKLYCEFWDFHTSVVKNPSRAVCDVVGWAVSVILKETWCCHCLGYVTQEFLLRWHAQEGEGYAFCSDHRNRLPCNAVSCLWRQNPDCYCSCFSDTSGEIWTFIVSLCRRLSSCASCSCTWWSWCSTSGPLLAQIPVVSGTLTLYAYGRCSDRDFVWCWWQGTLCPGGSTE